MADGRLEAAISHWAPRFTAAGVYRVDFDRITSALNSWDEWCQGWSQAAAQHAELGHQSLEQGRTRSAGGHLAQAAVYYHFAKFLFVHDIAQCGPFRLGELWEQPPQLTRDAFTVRSGASDEPDAIHRGQQLTLRSGRRG